MGKRMNWKIRRREKERKEEKETEIDSQSSKLGSGAMLLTLKK